MYVESRSISSHYESHRLSESTKKHVVSGLNLFPSCKGIHYISVFFFLNTFDLFRLCSYF
jgi:hypothetical protein